VTEDRARRVAVVGGGVSGLTTAYRLAQADPALEVHVFEAGPRMGGKLRSVAVGDLVLPAGADSFLARKPWALALCKELGIADELVSPGTSGSYLWTDKGLAHFAKDAPFGIPGDVSDVFRWPGLSKAGRRRAAQDLVRGKRKEEGDETLGSLLRRRLGDEATDLAIAPLLGGLFEGDIDRLSVLATFPELAAWERSQGSLVRGSQAATRNARRAAEPGPMFLRPRDGVERMTETLAQRLDDARLHPDARVVAVALHDDGYRLRFDTDAEPVQVDAVVLAPEAHVAAELLRPIAPAVAEELGGIPYASTGVVLMTYAEGTARQLPPGTGFVVPRGKAPMTASTWLSNKWPTEAFGTRAVIRSYVGAVGEEDVLGADDADIVNAVARFHAAVVPLPDEPQDAAVVRWPRSMPQFELGHLDRVARIRTALPAGIFVTGQAYDGVGIPDCVRGAGETAEAVAAHLRDAQQSKETVS
jgi:protoporphyrinogen/coproporphyrinogen III oxidase